MFHNLMSISCFWNYRAIIKQTKQLLGFTMYWHTPGPHSAKIQPGRLLYIWHSHQN